MLKIKDGVKYLIDYNGNSFKSSIKIKDGKYYSYDYGYNMQVVFTDESIKNKVVKVAAL